MAEKELPISWIAKKFAHMNRRQVARDIGATAALTLTIILFLMVMFDAEGRRPSEILLDILF